MAKFVLVYQGKPGMGDTPEEQQALAQDWLGWYGALGESVVDGGNGFGASATLRKNGAPEPAGASGLTGYLIITADTLDAAIAKSHGCPALSTGGRIEIYEALAFG